MGICRPGERCPLQVLLEDVVLTNANGNYSLIDDSYSTVTACVDTIQNAFYLDADHVCRTWQNLTRWVANDSNGAYTQQTYPVRPRAAHGNSYDQACQRVYQRDSSLRACHARAWNRRAGKYAVVNNSRIMAAVQSGPTDLGDNVPILGGVFLSQNYIHVDYNASMFWLSPQVGNGTCRTGSQAAASQIMQRPLAQRLEAAPTSAWKPASVSRCCRHRARGILHDPEEGQGQSATAWFGRLLSQDTRGGQQGIAAGGRRMSELAGEVFARRRVSEVAGKEIPIHKDDVNVVVDVEESKPST